MLETASPRRLRSTAPCRLQPRWGLSGDDLVGLDVRLAIAEHLHRALRSEAFCPPEILRRMVAEGKLGKKAGQGFYRWDPA
jgi:3-hydroxybutyryl-CoA dehydrogenase